VNVKINLFLDSNGTLFDRFNDFGSDINFIVFPVKNLVASEIFKIIDFTALTQIQQKIPFKVVLPKNMNLKKSPKGTNLFN